MVYSFGSSVFYIFDDLFATVQYDDDSHQSAHIEEWPKWPLTNSPQKVSQSIFCTWNIFPQDMGLSVAKAGLQMCDYGS